jgi:GT2 family glycosyltransferase
MYDVVIIIINWNTSKLLKNCIDSVKKYTQSVYYKICVVDNASIDNSVDMLKEEFPDVLLIENKQNVGFAVANNQAMKCVNGQYYLLLNSDTLFIDNVILKMLQYAKEVNEFGIIAPQLLNSDLSIQKSTSYFPSFYNSILLNVLFVRKVFSKFKYYDKVKLELIVSPVDVDYVSGACMLVNRDALQEVGYLDEDYFMYGEDIDWCYRFHKYNWRVIYNPLCQLIHLGNQSGKEKWGNSRLAVSRVAEEKFYRKNYGKLAAKFFRYKTIILALLRLFYLKVFLFFYRGNQHSIDLRNYCVSLQKVVFVYLSGKYS